MCSFPASSSAQCSGYTKVQGRGGALRSPPAVPLLFSVSQSDVPMLTRAGHRRPARFPQRLPVRLHPWVPPCSPLPKTPAVAVFLSLLLYCFFTTGSGESLNLPEPMEGLILCLRNHSVKKELGTASLGQSQSCDGRNQRKDAQRCI